MEGLSLRYAGALPVAFGKVPLRSIDISSLRCEISPAHSRGRLASPKATGSAPVWAKLDASFWFGR